MPSYAEYLRSEGASDEDIKILDTAAGRRAFEKLQARLDEASGEVEKVRAVQADYEKQVDTWYTTERDKNKSLQSQLIEAQSREAALKAQREGLLAVARDLGYDPDKLSPPVKPPETPPTGAFDPDKYTNEVILPLAKKESRAIAKMAMLTSEHARLGLPADVDWMAMLDDSERSGKSIEQLWTERYKVADVRAAQAKAAQDAHDKKIADDAVAAARGQWVSEYGNPNTRPLVPSTNTFTTRKDDNLRAKQPWEHNDSKLSNDRVERATKKLVEQTFGTH